MIYKASFEIDRGVFYFFRWMSTKRRRVYAGSQEEAYRKSMTIANKIARRKIAGHHAKVRLLALRSSDGEIPFDALRAVVDGGELERELN